MYSFRAINPIGEIENMFIDRKYRHTGIGGKLIEQTKKLAKEQGVKKLKVGALANNKNAIDFYKFCNFDDFELILETKF